MPDQYFGKYTGIVKDNRDAQKLGQLQVSVPAIFPPDELVTARAALPYGFFFVPEAEAKVWIEFEGGDSGLPIWTGVQYVPGEWAPEAEADPPQKRVIKTASGHLLIFNDASGEEAIQIRDGVNGHDIKLDNQGIQVTDGRNQHQVTLDSSGITVQAQSGAKVQLTAAGVSVNAGSAMVEVTGTTVRVHGGTIMLSDAALMPVLRATLDQGIGNLGAPVPLIGPGNPNVLA
jgi:hypothetical protein